MTEDMCNRIIMIVTKRFLKTTELNEDNFQGESKINHLRKMLEAIFNQYVLLYFY